MREFTVDLSRINAGQLEVSTYPDGSAELVGDLPKQCGYDEAEDPLAFTAVKAVENSVLAHAAAGVDVGSAEYVEGLVTILETIGNEF